MAKKFFEIFECCREDAELRELLESTTVTALRIDRASGSLSADLFFPRQPAPVTVSRIESAVKAEFGLSSVSVSASAPPPQSAEQKNGRRQLMGNAIRGKDTTIGELDQYSGKVSVTGDVFGTEKRTVRGGLRIVEFNITDHTGTLRVSKMLRDPADNVLMDIEDGMYLRVAGLVKFNTYVGDLAMEPVSVCKMEKPVRMDECGLGKRVELHLHTKFSALDALTDIDEVVKTAARWGHKAIAVTDHGVVQAFPNMCSAGKKYGVKILYGCEAYYINDVDDHVAVEGASDELIDGDFVAFDLETTGLSSRTDAITEIGAVRFSGGKAVDRMCTFVDPGRSIPDEVVRLTGISDEDVAGAPGQEEAVRRFLEFAGDLPLAAHNAAFDMGFIRAACDRYGLECNNASVDTLTLSRALMTKLKRFSLDVVAGALSLPEFNHHRADADAETCGLIALNFFGKLREAGVATLGGINGYLASIRGPEELHRQPRHLIILVKTQKGLRNLYELVSLAHLKYFRKQPIIPKSLLMEKREGLILGSACENGEVFRAVTGNRSDAELDRLASFYDFLEIQPICNNAFMIAEGKAADEDALRAYNVRVVELAQKLGKPVCATGDVHFLEPDDEIFRRILISNKFSDADRPLPIYFKTTDEMLEEFSYLGPELAKKVVIDDPNAVADMIDVVAPLPKGLFPPMIENSAKDLQDLVYGKLHAMYGENPPAIVTDRVEAELHDILARGYDVIYMSAQKLVAKSNAAGYLVGSRGSVGSAVVAFFSGITEVNALPPHYRCPKCHHCDFEAGKDYGCGPDMPEGNCPVCGEKYAREGFDIPFETFLGFGGDKVPDIDLNFSGEYQAQAHRDTIELFGADHVFRAGTIGTVKEKTAYGYVKKYLEERGLTKSRLEEDRLSRGFAGVKRTTGQHPGGLVVIPQDHEVYDFCPVQHPADDPDSDIITTHFEYHSMEENLLKLDMLGHDDPTMIHMLTELTGIDALSLPLNDPDTMSIFVSPEKLGLPDDDPIIGKVGSFAIPEFGTRFTREMLVDTKPDKVSTLVRLSGFSHGTDVWAGNIKDLILSGTATVEQTAACRDDIMLYLIGMGMEAKKAFKFMEAVRKGVIHKGKSWPEGIEDELRQLNVPEWYIDSCKKIQYLFPKAHAVAYVTMALRIAWFKVHRPIEFYCAYFTVRAPAFDLELMTSGIDKVRAAINDFYSRSPLSQLDQDKLTTLEVVYEFLSRGFDFAPMDLRRSDAMKFTIDGKRLIPPFAAVAGLGEAAAQDIVSHRDDDIISVEEFAAACSKVSKTHIETLKKLGVFGDMPEAAQMSLF